MKRLVGLFAGMLMFMGLFAGSLEFRYEFGGPVARSTGDFQSVVFRDTYLTGKTGEPALPYQAVKLLLPPGEEAVRVEYIFEDEQVIQGTFVLYPQQPSHPISLGGDGVFHRKDELYRSTEPYPSRPWGEFSTQFLNGRSFLLASFTPLKYVPATGVVSYYGSVTVKVETRATHRAADALQNLGRSVKSLQRIQSMAQNQAMMNAYPEPGTRDQDFQILIITPQQFAAAFQPLRDIYLKRGLKSETATMEYISANSSGQDLKEKVRNYIIQEYQGHGIEYVLLGGDVEHVPVRGFYCYVQSGGGYEDNNIPSDLYYSALDGTWNTNGNNRWGEPGEDDLLPEVAVARFPFSNASQLNNLINKTISYQEHPVTGELRNPIMAGEHLWDNPLTYGEDYLELLIGYREDNGYTTNGIPEDYTFNKLYDHIAYWSGNNLIQAINQGSSFIHHSGHANQSYVMRLDISQITSSNFSPVNGTTHNYSLVYTHGCLCGAFDENDCIGEAMVLIDKFAVAGAFNSRYGWFNEGQTEGPSAHLHREFVDALYTDGEQHIGSAHLVSRMETSPWVTAPGQWEEGALRWCFYCCNILGDPVLGIWTDEPIPIETVYPEEIPDTTTVVPILVTSNGQPVAGLVVTIMTDGELAGFAPVDCCGQTLVEVPGGFVGVDVAEIVVSGYNCLATHYPLSIMVGVDEREAALKGFRVYPNPFRDHLSLTFDAERPSGIEVTFISLSGQVVLKKEYQGTSGMNMLTINAKELPEGLMTLRVNADGKIAHERIVHFAK